MASEAIYERSPDDAAFRLVQDRPAVMVGVALASLAPLLILIHVVTDPSAASPNGVMARIHNAVDIGRENSFSERFNHGMLFLSSVLLVGMSFSVRARLPVFLGAFLGFAWLDDSSMYHERMGVFLSELWTFPSFFGLEPHDIGELLAWGLAALILFPLGLWAFMKRRAGDATVLRLIFLPLGALIFSAVAFDVIHAAVAAPSAEGIFVVLEDGGEMLATAAIVAVSLALFRNVRRIYGPDGQPGPA